MAFTNQNDRLISFSKLFSEYFHSLVAKKPVIMESMPLRLYVANPQHLCYETNDPEYLQFIDGSQQGALDFLICLIDSWPTVLSNRFKFRVNIF